MIRFLLQRLLLLADRLAAVAVSLLLLMELAFCVLGGSDRHVWATDSWRAPGGEFAAEGDGWGRVLADRTPVTLRAAAIAWGGALLIGYSWGILGARLRRFRATRWIALPFHSFACVPGFFFVVLVAIYSCYQWQRPGFANEVVVETGPDLLGWWHALVVALPALAGAAAWQLRAVSYEVEREAVRPFVKGLYLAGYRDDDIFYGNVCRRARSALAGQLDRTLPFILGSHVVVEWAFRYEGVGSLLVEATRADRYEGIFLSGLWMAAAIGVASLAREVGERFTAVDR